MDRKQFSDKQIKTAGTTKTVITRTFQAPDYDIEPRSDTAATDTGLVTVARLIPKTAGDPNFRLRWDDAGDELDIDIYVGGQNQRELWKKPGYRGHKPTLLDSTGREYAVDIAIPGKNIFQGTVKVGLLTAIQVSDAVAVSDLPPVIKII